MRTTLLAAALAALGLSGCNSLSGKTPQEMMQISMARSLKQDYSYNFSGESRIYLSKQEDGVAPEVAGWGRERTGQADGQTDGEAAGAEGAEADQDALMSATGRDLMQALTSGGAGRGLGNKMADALQKYPGLANYLANGRINFDGAVDLRQELMEIVPELVLNGRNEQIAVKMPILLDGKNMSITADLPDSVQMALNFKVGEPMRKRLGHEPIRITMKDENKKGIPVRNAVKAAVYASYKAYGELPPQSFKLREMDDFGRQIGGRYRLELVMDDETNKAYYEAAVREFSAKLDELAQSSPEAGATPEGYEKVRNMAKGLMRLVNGSVSFTRLYGGPAFVSFYLDGKGRMLGMRQYMQFNGSSGQALNIDSNLKLYHFGKPVFTFKPQNVKTIGLDELMMSMQQKNQAKYDARHGRSSSGRADAVAEIALPFQPHVVEEKVLAE
ncbi:hypothetical protein LVJ83_05735 [Uruburuella testudinis]|uniref:Lipoprotein n=1 Tax=Uruburuella testudinis TaxID=1282863 RepID=A0ABY4DVU0_9NEIS|nr:hypothetical protein [Uruburuella testudinis]UOO82961.1 hypothetical protein LVJ83_05735 [Uruburuella testudinis]